MIKADIKQLGQRQDSFYDQLLTVHDAAVKLGCYDVADSLQRQIENIQARLRDSNRDWVAERNADERYGKPDERI